MSKINFDPHADRISALTQLIEGQGLLSELDAQLKLMPFDSEPLVTLTASHIEEMLTRFANGAISDGHVEQWADLIEVRDDIAFDPDSETKVKQVIHELANPVLFGPLDHYRAQSLMRSLVRV
jgi:hypothetical protein